MPSINVVSNRLPIRLHRRGGDWQLTRGSGGLVQALEPVLARSGGHWFGWPGVAADEIGGAREVIEQASADLGYQLSTVDLTTEEVNGFYRDYANGVLWPLFHGFSERCRFNGDGWEWYTRVNRTFAQLVASELDRDSAVWIQDYQLLLLGKELRELGHQGPLGLFLHIPFPPVEDFVKLPNRDAILAGLLDHDLVGFQTGRDEHNFVDCVRELFPRARVQRPNHHELTRIEGGERVCSVGSFPIGVDVADFGDRATTARVKARAAEIRDAAGGQLLLGVGRLDYSKGLLERLEALEVLLEARPELIGQIRLIEICVPSRESLDEYQRMRLEIERTVGRICGRFSTPVWTPIIYKHGSVSKDELAALYSAADVALVTSLRDGMNLVAKEFCAASVGEAPGVLVLSEMAGAAAQLSDSALLINPHDVHQTARAMAAAIDMPPGERRRRMRAAREVIADQDVFWWADRFLQALHEPRQVRVESSSRFVPDARVRAPVRP